MACSTLARWLVAAMAAAAARGDWQPRSYGAPGRIYQDTLNTTAVCVSGVARTFALPIVHGSWNANFLSRLPGRVSLFMYLKTDETSTGGVTSNYNPASPAAIRAAAATLRPPPRTLEIVNNHGDFLPFQRELDPSRGDCLAFHTEAKWRQRESEMVAGMNLRTAQLDQIWTTEQCYKLVEAAEAAQGWKFDYYVHVRVRASDQGHPSLGSSGVAPASDAARGP